MIALLEDEAAGDETSAPVVVFCSVLGAISGKVFLGNAVDDGSNSRPRTGTGTHGAGFVSRVEDEIGEVAAITT